uniref:Uncharacterized protein n=1 Tax=Pipistrellus kuhlii TaxID=59472 RepID=A0A7J7SFP5_PIPKU|nr:hypothetical protein mPipKuh1_009989 [Pipistrellus kuhlii]
MSGQACNPGMCGGPESKPGLLSPQAEALSTEPHRLGLMRHFYFSHLPTFSGHICGLSWLVELGSEKMIALAINPQPHPYLSLHTPEWGAHLSLSFPFPFRTSGSHLEDRKSPTMVSLKSC